nr:hypothetical protein GW17_00007284 [Ipomoea batatas]
MPISETLAPPLPAVATPPPRPLLVFVPATAECAGNRNEAPLPSSPPPLLVFVPAMAECAGNRNETARRPSVAAELGFKNQDYRGSHGVIREETSPAERASGVGQKPSVYTLHVEGMAAFWEQSEIIFPLKLTQTHCTIKVVLVFQTNYGFVVENWKGINERLVHPSIMEVKKLLQLALQSCDIINLIWIST